MITYTFPWYLFKRKNKPKDIMTDDKIKETHDFIEQKISEMLNKTHTKEEVIIFVDNVNRMMRNKYGDDWVDFNIN
jgi:hypothetical protein